MKPERSGDRTEAAADLARLLALPPERELSGSRHRQLKEHLMQEITHETAQAEKRQRPRRRLGYVAVPLIAATAVAVFAVTAGNGAAPAKTGGGTVVGADTTKTLLDDVANVAASKPIPNARDNQFVYVKSEVSFEQDTQDSSGYHSTLAPLHTRQIWQSVNGSRAGLLREGGQDTALSAISNPNVSAPDFRYLETLPTDPSALLDKIYADTRSTSPAEAFATIGDLLSEQIAPPAVSAALYRAAAMIPGVRVIGDVVDVTGHHDIAVALNNPIAANEWLFNKSSLEFVGQQSVSLKAGKLGPAGTIEGTQIIQQSAVVDSIGDTR